jgi:hypothetical protein
MECHRQKTRPKSGATVPALDLLRMPRELLPSVEAVCASSTEQWPYVNKATVKKVKAMMVVQCRHTSKKGKLSTAWSTMQARMKQYAETGRGTVAEAIVHNEFYWRGQQNAETVMQSVLSKPPEISSTASVLPRKPSIVEQCTIM